MSTPLSTIAKQLLDRRNHTKKFPRLLANERPDSIDQALAIQGQMSVETTAKIGGWKCLLPLDDEKVIVAPIYSNTIWQEGEAKFHPDNNNARVEPEIAFILSKDLPAKSSDYSEEEIDQAIGTTHMALELIQSRFDTDVAEDEAPNFYELLADGLSNQGLYIGTEIEKAAAYQASEFGITIEQASKKQQFSGRHPNPLPQLPIYWLINYMSKKGISFQAGQAIITGSYAGVVNLVFDEALTMTYENLGCSKVLLTKY